MKYTIEGTTLQIVNVELEQGETLDSSAGMMAYMTDNIVMESKMKGGLMSGLKRTLTGSSLFLVKYTANNTAGRVALAGHIPGKIVDLDISKGSWIVQKTGYLGSSPTVTLDIAFQKRLGSIFFGGEGFILQRLSGSGVGFINACGDMKMIELAQGERLKVSTSCAVAWQDSVQYSIDSIGLKNALFSGEGLFVTTLTGPGKVVVQSMTMEKFAQELIPYLPSNNSS